MWNSSQTLIWVVNKPVDGLYKMYFRIKPPRKGNGIQGDKYCQIH